MTKTSEVNLLRPRDPPKKVNLLGPVSLSTMESRNSVYIDSHGKVNLL